MKLTGKKEGDGNDLKKKKKNQNKDKTIKKIKNPNQRMLLI